MQKFYWYPDANGNKFLMGILIKFTVSFEFI